jgi:hypothetical protein
MSGGSLDYVCYKVQDAASSIEFNYKGVSPIHIAFAKHLKDVAKALHDIELVLSSDMSKGDDLDSIKKVLSQTQILTEAILHAEKASIILEKALLEAKENDNR